VMQYTKLLDVGLSNAWYPAVSKALAADHAASVVDIETSPAWAAAVHKASMISCSHKTILTKLTEGNKM